MVGILGSVPITVTGSAVLGTGGAQSILGAADGDTAGTLFGNIGSTNSSLFNQIKNNASQRLADALQAVNSEAADRTAAINVQNERWIAVKAQVNNAQIAVENGQESAQKVADTLLLMRGSIAGAGNPAENQQLYREQFDAQVNAINNEADAVGPAFNLVGSINRQDGTFNTIEYRSDVNLNSSTLTGTYIGSDFRIEANDGRVWIPDLGSDFIQSYTNGGTEAEKYTTTDGETVQKATSTRNGMKLISYDANTKNITVEISVVPDDPPITVTGKLKTNGLGVMQSWFYNDFATQADRSRAFKDIDAAEVNLQLARGALERSAAQTSMDQRKADRGLNELSDQTIKSNNAQSQQTEELRIKAAQQYQAMMANLQNIQTQQSNYLQAFSSFVGDAFTQSLLDINS